MEWQWLCSEAPFLKGFTTREIQRLKETIGELHMELKKKNDW